MLKEDPLDGTTLLEAWTEYDDMLLRYERELNHPRRSKEDIEQIRIERYEGRRAIEAAVRDEINHLS